MTEKDRHLSSSSATHNDDESHVLPPVRTTVNINPQVMNIKFKKCAAVIFSKKSCYVARL